MRPYTHREFYGTKVKDSLYQYLWERKDIPTFRSRPCTTEYKKELLRRYANGRKQMIGICADELNRIKEKKDKIYPLRNITRMECYNLISMAKLPPAHKTGCWLCPFQRKLQWINLYKNYPNLWKMVIELEKNSRFTFKHKITLEDQMKKWLSPKSKRDIQPDLFR